LEHSLLSALQSHLDSDGELLEQYRTEDGIILFVHDVLGVTDIAPYQERILRLLVTDRKVAVRGLHGLGKTSLAAWVVLWVICCFEGDVKVPTTASKWRQLTHFLWPEIRKWARRADFSKLGINLRYGKELLETQIKLNGKEAFALASNDPGAIEGAHATTMCYIFDEAKSIPNDIFDAAEGAFSTAGNDTSDKAFAFVISTPGTAAGRFYDIHARKPGFEDWTVVHVTKEEAIEAGRVSQEWVDARARQWGTSSAVYQMRVEGEFDISGEHNLIPLAWIEAANDRWHDANGKGAGQLAVGCDPARFGEDKTAIAVKVGDIVESIEYYSKADTMQTTGRVVAAVDNNHATPIAVDVIGIGGGVVDRLNEQGYSVQGVNVGHGSTATDASGEIGFVNLRSQLWWMMRELLDPANSPTLALPPDDRLTGDLVTPQYGYTSTGKIKVESKDDMRKRIGRSTDSADAVMLSIYATMVTTDNKLHITSSNWVGYDKRGNGPVKKYGITKGWTK